MKPGLVIFALMSVCAAVLACSNSPPTYSIADAEAAGFSRGDEQVSRVRDALEGWPGTMDGSRVEIYVMERQAHEFFFERVQAPDPDEWEVIEVRGNLVLVCEKESACDALLESLP